MALHAEGRAWDALSILDQAISYADNKVEVSDVLAVTGGVSQDILTEMTAAMFDKDTKGTLNLFDDIVKNGKDPGRFVFDYIYFLRDMLFYKSDKRLAAMERDYTDVFKTCGTGVVQWINVTFSTEHFLVVTCLSSQLQAAN